MDIAFEYPNWFLLLCVLTGLLFAAGLYYKERKSELPDLLRMFLAAFRLVSVSIIAFLLLSPFLKSWFEEQEKPVVILAVDNSGSLITGEDSVFYQGPFLESMDDLKSELAEQYELNLYSFGERVKRLDPLNSMDALIDFSEKQTNISSLFSEIKDIYSNRNVGALIMTTDGIYNTGANPVYYSRELGFPVYCVALGDTTKRKDVVISRVNYNRLAFLGNDFPVEVVVNADKCGGERVRLKVSKGGKQIGEQEIDITGDAFTTPVNFQLKAEHTGIQRYRFSVEPVANEISTVNNRRDVFVEVLDDKSKVLILYHAPHPDISALKEAIRSNQNYEVDDFPAASFALPVDEYDLLILHQLPSLSRETSNIIGEAREKKVPYLIVVGGQTNLLAFNQLNTGLNIISRGEDYQEVIPIVEADFSLFSLPDDIIHMINSFPPLMAPFGDYQVSGSVDVLLSQKIGTMSTTKPLLMFNETHEGKWGVLSGSGLWRWRLLNFAQARNHDAFNGMILKTVQFLSLKEKKSQFRIYHNRQLLENQRIIFDAEVYNKSYELITGPEVEITITDAEGNQFPFMFSKYQGAYHLDAGSFGVGEYQYVARVSVGNETFTLTGHFSVSPLEIETLNILADHNLLYNISEGTDGLTIYADGIPGMPELIKEREDIKTLVYSQKRFEELINIPLVLVLILALLAIEWFLRKRAGSY